MLLSHPQIELVCILHYEKVGMRVWVCVGRGGGLDTLKLWFVTYKYILVALMLLEYLVD